MTGRPMMRRPGAVLLSVVLHGFLLLWLLLGPESLKTKEPPPHPDIIEAVMLDDPQVMSPRAEEAPQSIEVAPAPSAIKTPRALAPPPKPPAKSFKKKELQGPPLEQKEADLKAERKSKAEASMAAQKEKTLREAQARLQAETQQKAALAAKEKKAKAERHEEAARRKTAEDAKLKSQLDQEKKQKAQKEALVKEAKEKAAAKSAQEEAQKAELLLKQKAAEAKEQQRKGEAEAKRKSEELQKQKAEEAQRKEALQASMAQEEAHRREEAKAVEAQAEKAAQIFVNRYFRPRVEKAWLKPASAVSGMSCKIQVRLQSDGRVSAVEAHCAGGDAAFERSAEAAVRKAAPFPMPHDEQVAAQLLGQMVTFRFSPE